MTTRPAIEAVLRAAMTATHTSPRLAEALVALEALGDPTAALDAYEAEIAHAEHLKVANLAMLVRRMVAYPKSREGTIAKAMDYLQRIGEQGSPLRDALPPAPRGCDASTL